MPIDLRQLFAIAGNEEAALHFLQAQGLLRRDGPYCPHAGCPRQMTMVKYGSRQNKARIAWR